MPMPVLEPVTLQIADIAGEFTPESWMRPQHVTLTAQPASSAVPVCISSPEWGDLGVEDARGIDAFEGCKMYFPLPDLGDIAPVSPRYSYKHRKESPVFPAPFLSGSE